MAFFTIGHSDRAIETFLELLQEAGVESLVDVRKLPGSRSNPQFDEEPLAHSLVLAGIRYRHDPELGGLRPTSKSVPPEINGLWRNRSFHNYADYATGQEFDNALQRLRDEGTDRPTVVMCSEAVWWRCHRRIIADHLLANEHLVQHIMAEGRVDDATLTPGARVQANRNVTYPAPVLPPADA